MKSIIFDKFKIFFFEWSIYLLILFIIIIIF